MRALIAIASFLLTPALAMSHSFAAERQVFEVNKTDLCPKSGAKYGHHLVLLDVSTPLSVNQKALVKRFVFSEANLLNMRTGDRLTIMALKNVEPSANKPVFSKCRPRSGEPSRINPEDEYNWLKESKREISRVFRGKFVDGVNNALADIYRPGNNGRVESPLLSQIYEISRDVEFGLGDQGYEFNKLTIISDLVQNSSRLPFYDECNTWNKKCPTWDSFKNSRKYRKWVSKTKPKFAQGLEVELLYLNRNYDPDLNRGILDFWHDYFKDAGVSKISDMIGNTLGK